MNIEFRKATNSDIGRLAIIRQKQLKEAGAISEIDISKNITDYFNAAMADNTFVAWVATIEDKIISTAGISFQKKPPYYSNVFGLIGEICNVFTEKEYRRRGLAKKLLKHIVDEAKSRWRCCFARERVKNGRKPI